MAGGVGGVTHPPNLPHFGRTDSRSPLDDDELDLSQGRSISELYDLYDLAMQPGGSRKVCVI